MTDLEQPIWGGYDNGTRKLTVTFQGETKEFEGDLADAQNEANNWLREKGCTVH